MKLLKLLNKKNLSILLICLFFNNSYSNEPVDIWKINKNTKNNEVIDSEEIENKKIILNQTISPKKNIAISTINQEENLLTQSIDVAGIYDPSDNDLSIDMWVNSNGLKILEIINKINKVNLSKDSVDILNITLLTNSYFPQKNITKGEFLKIKSDLIIKQKNLNLIENYLEKNKNLENHSDLIRYYVEYYLSNADVAKSCEIFNKVHNILYNNYILKFKIYCLVNSEKKEEAQLQFDLLKENGFEEVFFEKKISNLLGYNEDHDSEISENSLLDFHLSHRLSSDFTFVPKINTSKLIWRYLSSSNLLEKIDLIDLDDHDKISIIEKATHDKNYDENELFNLYKRFLFNINQLLTVEESYKLLPNSESRALLYQGVLLNKEPSEKIKLLKLLKNSFEKENISNAFDVTLMNFLKEIDKDSIPSNHTKFYESYLKKTNLKQKKIKLNNKIIHQSKLLNYFREDLGKQTTEKDLEQILKKIKKDKNYFFSIKDAILLESLKSDGIKIPKKYRNIYETPNANIPYDIQILINRGEVGLTLLRLVEVIGEDKIIDIDSETLYFVISTLNQLNIDSLRNEILLKILPLKI